MDRPLKVLILEDSPLDVEMIVAELRRGGPTFEWRRVDSREAFLAELERPTDVIISDYSLPGFTGLEALRLVRDREADLPFILVTGEVGEETAVVCIKEGADDYLLKDRMGRLGAAVAQAIDKRRLHREKHAAEQALRERQAELATIFESAPVAIVIVDNGRRVARANRAATRLAGQAASEIHGLLIGDAIRCLQAVAQGVPCGTGEHCETCPLKGLLLAALETGSAKHDEECTLCLAGDGSARTVTLSVSAAPIGSLEDRMLVVALEDITERREAEERVRFLNRILDTIREINRLIVHEKDREKLLAETCRIVVEHGQFAMAWIGEANTHQGTIAPLAVAGREEGFLEEVQVCCDDSPAGRCPAGRAIREGRLFVANDLARGPADWPGRAAALERGFSSVAALPICPAGQDFGVLVVFADAPAVFDGETSDLLSELAGDLSYALEALQTAEQRRRAIADLKDSEERFRSIFEHSPAGIYRTTPGGQIIAANPALLRILGYDTFDELAARDLEEQGAFLPSTPRSVFKGALERDGLVSGLESAWITADGRTVWVREHATAVRGKDGRVLFFEGSVEDVTERHLAEQALSESEERYRRFFMEDITADYVATVDGAIIDCNPAFVRVFGFASVDEAKATNLTELYPSPAARQELLRLLHERRGLEYHEVELRQMNGTPLTFIANLSGEFDESGELQRIRGYLLDITEMRRLEEQFRHAQKMEAVGRLAGGVAHDFNNLLQAMITNATLLRAAPGNSDRVTEGLEEIEHLIRRGASLTRQLLAFSRRSPAKVEHIDLNEVLRNSGQLLRHLVREDIKVSLDLADENLKLQADRFQLEQVMMNLVVNACDAMPDGGVLTVRSGASLDSSSVWFEVEDSGHGMTDDMREKIFEPFFTTKGEGKGTGLGLSVVHGIVSQHGGHIEVASSPGRGTLFRIMLPRQGSGEHPPVRTTSAAAPQLMEGRGQRVLVVEDEAATRETLCQILTVLGYEVVSASSAGEAEAAQEENTFDVVLTDLMLPDGSGADLARRLQRKWPELAVVLMSGYGEDGGLGHETDHVGVRFLQKPFAMDALAREIHAALDNR